MIDTDKYEGSCEACTDSRATVFDEHGNGIGGWIDCSQQKGSKSIESTYWCRACIKYYGGEEE
tara:strand:+ start:224 stop:412 length:189 start_codon:yes stop_codon:yes gene_type:complete